MAMQIMVMVASVTKRRGWQRRRQPYRQHHSSACRDREGPADPRSAGRGAWLIFPRVTMDAGWHTWPFFPSFFLPFLPFFFFLPMYFSNKTCFLPWDSHPGNPGYSSSNANVLPPGNHHQGEQRNPGGAITRGHTPGSLHPSRVFTRSHAA